VDSDYASRNDATRQRLAEAVDRLSAVDLDRSLGDGWTVKAALAHLAFWDRLALGLLDRWQRDGFAAVTTDPEAINTAALTDWLALSHEQVRKQVVAGAEALDQRIAGLNPELVEAIKAGGSERTLDRSRHRNEHLDQIGRALGG
jgi:Mycothiol maleylpyruvate isomerase N-terminal domain